jgi:hypothetical protein
MRNERLTAVQARRPERPTTPTIVLTAEAGRGSWRWSTSILVSAFMDATDSVER